MTAWAAIGRTDYWVSDQGGVAKMRLEPGVLRVPRDDELLPQRDDGRGYLCVDLVIDGKRQTRKVHQLVAAAFLGPTPRGYHIDHCDHDKTNNRLLNLRWRDARENSSDCRRGSRAGCREHCAQTRNAFAVLVDQGWSTSDLAAALQISPSTARRWRREYLK